MIQYIPYRQHLIPFTQTYNQCIDVNFENIHFNDSLRISLSVMDEKYQISFDVVVAFRVTSKASFLQKEDDVLKNGLYLVENSTYKKWHEEECLHKREYIKNFAAVFSGYIVDVLTVKDAAPIISKEKS